ncbi:hypothetical protein JAAARDRAFT_123877 [Jaapia argillacea MUCL 33604]|uniref:Translation machinery-associated protein 16 n=1 Tax=Jaapia argillacea MUCL 33604 TaxID=933084 RepID=A0A067QD90_9AGAM|nr:hypothetical protein JAAARDRAFT_123877 [Jaapia argillacea MUCL 33604]
MTNAKSPKAPAKPKEKKEKVFHPQSRKAGQLSRTQLRKTKLSEASTKRARKHSSQADIHGFFYHAMPDEGLLTLEDLHSLMGIWVTRHDLELEAERSARRKGRPKSTKEQRLEEMKLQDLEKYRTGIEIPDLTHEGNVKLFRDWDQKELAFLQLLRFIRISSEIPELAILTRRGKHPSLLSSSGVETEVQEQGMDGIESTEMILQEPPSRFASTMMTMDGTV